MERRKRRANGMRIYVVWVDHELEYASDKWLEARSRYLQLADGLGADRVDMTVEYV